MKRLHTLDFVDSPDSHHQNHNPDFIVSVAGEVPSLRNFGFRGVGNQNHFIQEFGKKYPRRNLLVDYLTYVPLSLFDFSNFCMKYKYNITSFLGCRSQLCIVKFRTDFYEIDNIIAVWKVD
jgi:hypothetical protein